MKIVLYNENFDMQYLLKKERDFKLDLIRFTGVLIIMVAHSNPPEWLFQLRNFGTPLLILGSALTYSLIYRYKQIDQIPFYKKRLARLTIPVWIFLTFFFFFFRLASLVLKRHYPFSQSNILSSYSFYDGIGFVWIFKVYIILALITPFSLKLSKSSIGNRKYFILLIIIYLAYELVAYLFLKSAIPDDSKGIITQYLLVIIPYSLLYLYGLRLHQLNNRNLYAVIFFSFLIFIFLAIKKYIDSGIFVQTQEYKYPPTLYYLSYAFFCINLFYYIVSRYISVTKEKVKNAIVWLSSNSLWIYLWHILAWYLWAYLIDSFMSGITGVFAKFLIKTVFLLLFGIAMTRFQISQVDKLLVRSNGNFKSVLLLFA